MVISPFNPGMDTERHAELDRMSNKSPRMTPKKISKKTIAEQKQNNNKYFGKKKRA